MVLIGTVRTVNAFPFNFTPPPSAPLGQFSNSSRMLVRATQPKDLLALADVLADSFHSKVGFGCWLYPLLRLGIYEDLRSRLRSSSPDYVCLVAVQPTHPTLGTDQSPSTDYVAGTVEMALRSSPMWERRKSKHFYLSNLAVRRECRRQGIAQQLLLACERAALKWGLTDLYLHVLENNEPARRLYEKLGYRLEEVEQDLGSWLLKRPRRCLLHKHLSA